MGWNPLWIATSLHNLSLLCLFLLVALVLVSCEVGVGVDECPPPHSRLSHWRHRSTICCGSQCDCKSHSFVAGLGRVSGSAVDSIFAAIMSMSTSY